MNKVILLGRLTRDPEVRYTQGTEPLCVSKYSLAVNRRFKKEGEPDADFINCVAFGKAGEFSEKYFKKGQQVSVIGRLQVRNYEKDGQKIWVTEVLIEDQFFADSKAQGASSEGGQSSQPSSYKKSDKPAVKASNDEPFYSIDEPIDDDGLPF